MKCKVCKSQNTKLDFIKNEIEYHICDDCGFMFIPKKFRRNVDYKNYKDQAIYDEIIKGNNWLKEQRHKLRIKDIRKYAKHCHLLDIGSGWGHFLHTANKNGYIGEGVEIAHYPHKYSVEELGLQVTNGNIFIYDPRHKYDMVTMWDVFEHIDDCNEVLQKSYSLLRSNGHIVFQVPMLDGKLAQKFGRDWHAIGLDHVNYFSSSNIGIILERNGFELKKIKTSIEVKLYLMYHFLNKKNKGRKVHGAERQAHYNETVNRPKWQLRIMVLIHNILYRTLQMFKYGDEMIVVAKKKTTK